jgi:squalene-associated FAD-dependent desaturase
MSIVHIVGAGVAGLACAVRLRSSGRAVVVHEAAPQAGGRCRSFHDETLGRRIDNGNHLLLSGNRAALAYLGEIGAADSLTGPTRAAFSFFELDSGRRWTVRPNAGRLPWWLLAPSRRVPDSAAADYLRGLALARAGPETTVAECFDTASPLYRRFWAPLAVAVLNTDPEEAAARLLWPVVAETFGRGEAATRPRIAAEGLSQSFVDPALAAIAAAGGEVRLSERLRAIESTDGRVVSLDFGHRGVALGAGDAVVLAVPPASASELLPFIEAPRASRPIVNAHFRLDRAPEAGQGAPILGLIGGAAQWLFLRGDVVSVTVSAARDLVEAPAEEIAARLWRDVAQALALDTDPPPPCRVVKERRATFAQVPAELPRRAPTRTRLANLFLAGDWTDTGLPATIEGAIRSGHAAAEAVRA